MKSKVTNGRKNRREIVGKATPRVEGEEKVSGSAVFAGDVSLPGMLCGKVLRSPIPYGRIRRIDVSRAVQLPGVRAILTGKDLHGFIIGRRIVDMPILAEHVVRFIGEKVVAIAAESEFIAEEALNRIEVEYEEWEPVLDPLEAMKPTAPLIHPDVASYGGLPHPLERASNVFFQTSWKTGDIEQGFKQSELIVENIFSTHQIHQAYIEPHSCLVRTDPSGGAEIWACSKLQFSLRRQVAMAIGVAPEKLILHPSYIGGDFGGKGSFMDVPLAYFLSLKTARPVKMSMTYADEFIAANPRHPSLIKVKTGVKKNGLVVAHQMEFIFDSGAYAAFKPSGFLTGAGWTSGPYKIPHVLLEEKMVYTNQVHCGHVRGPGYTQGFFATESQFDLVARQLGMDPAEFRELNLMRGGEKTPTGDIFQHVNAQETLRETLKNSGYARPKPKNVGRGLALCLWPSHGGECTVFITVDENGTPTVSSAVADQGSGTHTIMQQIVAEELKLPLDAVRVQRLDTSKVPPEAATGASRATRSYGNATYEAAREVVAQILKEASKFMVCKAENLTLANGRVSEKKNGRQLTYADLIKKRGSPIIIQSKYNNTDLGSHVCICAQVVEVEVDQETGRVGLRKVTTAHTIGAVLNPLMHQGQIEGGIMMGIGYALMENMVTDDGKVISANFGDYKIPTIRDIPVLETVLIETAVGLGPYGSVGIGEMSTMPAAAAIANAVEDAVGVRIRSLPITSEKILKALKEKC